MKRMNSKYALSLFLCIMLSVITGGAATAATVPDGVDLSIRLHNKQIYTTNTPVYLYAGISNSTDSPFTVHLADEKIFSLQITVTDIRNEALSPTKEYISRRDSDQQVLYREVRLLPGEEYGFKVPLSSFVDVKEPGIYFVQASMKPNIEENPELTSNEITLHIRPDKEASGESVESGEIEEQIESGETDILQKEQLSPDEVVRYMITARQQEDWKKFFLYLDVESLLVEHRLKRERYRRASDSERKRMIEDYKDLLRSSMVNNEILMKPDTFDIIRYRVDMSNKKEAEVTVRARFKYQDFTEIKMFTYYLDQSEGYWEVNRYEVTHEGTE
ncbi:MAG: hypothetical protein ACLFQW_05405 [Spirochaetaceae bacterium]